MKVFYFFLCSLLVWPLVAQQPVYTEQQKTDHLIVFVRNLKGATFIRNGGEHTPAAAADHLQYKREKAGSRLKTARDFIDKVATQSSMSGTPYMIRFANGKEFPAAMVLTNELNKLEAGKAPLLPNSKP
jgi:hypothetical protein